MPQKAFTGSLSSSHLLYLSFPLNVAVPALNPAQSSHLQHLPTTKAANRLQGLQGQRGPKWLLHLLPLLSAAPQLLQVLPSALKYHILRFSKISSTVFELHTDQTNASNSSNIWKKYFLLSRMAEIQPNYSPCNLTWASTSLNGSYHIKLGKIWQ